MFKLFRISFYLFFIVTAGCKNGIPADVRQIINNTANKKELTKFVDYYYHKKDSLKTYAAYFIIRNLDDQYFYKGKSVDSFKMLFNTLDSIVSLNIATPRSGWDTIMSMHKKINTDSVIQVKDIDIVTSDLLISNVENAFKAWSFPWAKQLTFDQFCKYILPYKLKNERPEDWRILMIKRYSWIIDSLKDKTNIKEATALINNDLKKWFYINTKFNSPCDPTCADLIRTKVGRCTEATQLTAYAMRAMGIPVTLDFTPSWANKSLGHDWNCLLYKNTSIVFMGTESNPGFEKIENSGYNFMGATGMKRKRAKIFRRSFEKIYTAINTSSKKEIPALFQNTHIEDVTNKFIPTSNVIIKPDTIPASASFAYLCVFNNRKWKPIYWGQITAKKEVKFSDMGRDVVYLPVTYLNNDVITMFHPFILSKNGEIKILLADTNSLITVRIDRKYPEDYTNKIFPGNNYEVYYWNKEWKSLGIQKADKDYLIYNNIPQNALLYIKNLDTGLQERIFTIENGKQVWW
jgi:hypothetical protein